MNAPLTASDSRERMVTVGGTGIRLLSYRIAERYFARAYEVSLGDMIGRASGATRDEAERLTLDAASQRIGHPRTSTEGSEQAGWRLK